jgi:hypothetical protein
MNFIFQVKNSKPDFLSEYNQARFKQELKDNEGRKYRISPVSPSISENKRGWYFGAVVPMLRQLNPSWTDLSDEQVHEILKVEFNGFEALGIDGQKKKYGLSAVSSDVPVEIFDNYILRIAEWVKENYGGISLPDSEYYKKNRDSAPMINDIEQTEVEYPESIGDPKF